MTKRRSALFGLGLVAIVSVVARVALRSRAPAANNPDSIPPAPSVTPSASSETQLVPGAVRYSCSELSPRAEAPESDDTSPAATLQRESRWYGTSALDCADGLELDRAAYMKIDGAISALLAAPSKDLPVLRRGLTQSAAMRVARCARPKPGEQAPAPASVDALRSAALRLMRRLALSEAEVATLKELARPLAEPWLGTGFEERATDGPQDSLGIHARSSALTLASRALPNDANGVATLYGDLVLITDRGVPLTAGVPAYVLRRRTSDAGLTVCFGALREEGKTCAVEMRPVDLPEGPLTLRGVTCDRCHIAGRRLSVPFPEPRSDGPLIEAVARWYQGASKARPAR